MVGPWALWSRTPRSPAFDSDVSFEKSVRGVELIVIAAEFPEHKPPDSKAHGVTTHSDVRL